MTEISQIEHPSLVLSRHWRDSDQGIELRYWLKAGSQAQCAVLSGQESVCFVARSVESNWHRLWSTLGAQVRVRDPQMTTLNGEPVLAVYSPTMADQRRWVRAGRDQLLNVWEDDINPADRYLMERRITAGCQFQQGRLRPVRVEPHLRALSIDIETAWYVDGECPALYSIALVGPDYSELLVVNRGQQQTLPEDARWLADETACLKAMVAAINHYDPDVIIGWNLIDFDWRILQQHADRLGVALLLGRDGSPIRWFGQKRERLDIEGRQVIDGIGALRSAAWFFESFALEAVARQLLGRGKAIADSDDRVGEIERLYLEDPVSLCIYNREDAQLVLDIFDQAGLWHFLLERAHLTGLTLDRAGGSAAAFNYVYLPLLHRARRVAPSVGDQTLTDHSPGGFVMDSKPGLYRDVLVLDFKSLYPSIIRTFLIDPLGLHRGLESEEKDTVPGFVGARFHRREHLLPAIIDHLWQARDAAKKDHNQPLSQAIKILMNSFYGVLGSNLCRFFDPRLASSITLRGHQILNESRDFIEQQGYPVIYGDTDSVFVLAQAHQNPDELGKQLASELNQWWRARLQAEFQLDCHLEMEYETHYRQFLMPTIRGLDTGSKKRYAGIIGEGADARLVFKGLEAVRSDWTALAKTFQQALYRLVFEGGDYRTYIVQEVAALRAGERDDRLLYRRRLRRPLGSYQRNKPPHVQAALKRKARQPSWNGRQVVYCMTVNGVEPEPFIESPPDYQHYLDKQLEPIADGILHFLDCTFSELVDDQLTLF